MNTSATCLICRGPALFEPESPEAPHVHRASCQVCGRYQLAWDAGPVIADPKRQPDLALLSAFVRQASDAGRIAELNAANWELAVEEMRTVPVAGKIRKTLRAIADNTRTAGDWLQCDPRSDFKAILQRQAGAANESELDFLLSALVRTGELTADLGTVLQDGWDVMGIAIQVTPEGWATIQAANDAVRGTCFVAMSFSPDLTAVYENAFAPAIASCGLQVVRVDRIDTMTTLTTGSWPTFAGPR